MKKLATILVCLLVVASIAVTVFAAGTEMTLTADKTNVVKGEVVTLTLAMPELKNCKSAGFNLDGKFDTNIFEFVGGQCTLTGTKLANVGYIDGKLSGSFVYENATTVSGNIFTIQLKVKNNASFTKTTIAPVVAARTNAGAVTVTVKPLELRVVCASHTSWDEGKVTKPTIGANNAIVNGYTTFTCNTCGFERVEKYTFPDVRSGAWYYQAVEFSAAKGYVSGHGNGTFGPSQEITRQDFVVIMARIAKADLSKYNGKTTFTDVPANAYYAKSIHWASANGIVSGYNDTKFGVGDKLTREQLVTILHRYAIRCGADVTLTQAGRDELNSFSDANKVNKYMTNGVIWALQNNVIDGMNATTLAPQGNATRAQVAAILFKISSYKVLPI